MADMKFSVSAKREGPALVRVQARNFSMYVDEPANLGGSDKGANPVEYLLGALAGCLNVVANLVANEMNIELRGMTIEAEGDLNPGRSHEAKMARNDRTAVSIKRQPDQSDAGEDHARVIGAPRGRARKGRLIHAFFVAFTLVRGFIGLNGAILEKRRFFPGRRE